MLERTSNFTVNPHMHPRHGLLRIPVLWLTTAFFELGRGGGAQVSKLQHDQEPPRCARAGTPAADLREKVGGRWPCDVTSPSN
jgi:hypothetical protein